MDTIKVLPDTITHLIGIDNPSYETYQFKYYPACKTAYTLSPAADFISVDMASSQITVDPTLIT